MKRMWRLAGIGCIAHVVLLLAGYSQQKSPMFGAAPADIAKTYAQVPATKMYVGGFAITLAWLVLLATLTLVARLLTASSDAGGWAAGLVAAGATVATAVTLAGAYATAGSAYYGATHGYAPDVVAGINMISKFADLLAMSAVGVTAVALGAAGLVSHRLPRWTAAGSLVVGGIGIASGASTGLLNVGNLLWLVWLVVVGVVLLRGPARPGSSEPAEPRLPAGADLSGLRSG
jgi:hypothetical protein